ncbi:hypothetical protein EV421DRAFT_1901872 [Armillaria borealis]|uniref:Uncharacterized protein n=1 Tax=Armillaria borealis TaxID=47425 RepID=A0AA39MTN3_9AGAR|nr:hypothetical protein EV421DRAFT_1901872 [Armillaria borealis]
MIVERFLGADPRNTNRLWDQMFRSSVFYRRKGFPIGHRPRYMGLAPEDLRGAYVCGSIKDEISFYITGPEPAAAKAMGFWGSKVPLPECVWHDYPIMVDCWMALNVQCTIELATACLDLNINWWEEEVLHPYRVPTFVLESKTLYYHTKDHRSLFALAAIFEHPNVRTIETTKVFEASKRNRVSSLKERSNNST